MRAYYPITDLAEGDWPIDPALALSIARRESEFDPGVISHAGAMGLMQVMPGTGRDTAAELGDRV
jgi:soluble lytic murein transglycosylase